jgi:hypothetical protein
MARPTLLSIARHAKYAASHDEARVRGGASKSATASMLRPIVMAVIAKSSRASGVTGCGGSSEETECA